MFGSGIMEEEGYEELRRARAVTRSRLEDLAAQIEIFALQMKEFQKETDKRWLLIRNKLVVGHSEGEMDLQLHENTDVRDDDVAFKGEGNDAAVVEGVGESEKFGGHVSGIGDSTVERKHSETVRVANDDKGLLRWGIGGCSNVEETSHLMMLKVDFPESDGRDLEDWLYKCQRYFELKCVPEDKKVKLASLYLYGPALQWHYSFIKNRKRGGSLEWEEYVVALNDRFGKEVFEDFREDESPKNIAEIDEIDEDVQLWEEGLQTHEQNIAEIDEIDEDVQLWEEGLQTQEQGLGSAGYVGLGGKRALESDLLDSFAYELVTMEELAFFTVQSACTFPMQETFIAGIKDLTGRCHDGDGVGEKQLHKNLMRGDDNKVIFSVLGGEDETWELKIGHPNWKYRKKYYLGRKAAATLLLLLRDCCCWWWAAAAADAVVAVAVAVLHLRASVVLRGKA